MVNSFIITNFKLQFMKAGKEYEIFIYDKLKKFFDGFDLKLNDKIIGLESGIKREIDISIRGKTSDVDLLYIVQCKDHSKPADIKIIGEFSSVIKDIGASKGFLVCASGFAKTIHTYALKLGIELISIEDINSNKWKTDIQIPIIYILKKMKVLYNSSIIVTDELAEKNKVDIIITENDYKEVSLNNGKTSLTIIDYISSIVDDRKFDITQTVPLLIDDANLKLKFVGIWVPLSIRVNFITEEIHYFKYLKPAEYSQLKNHVKKETIPLNILIKDFNSDLDDSYIKIDNNNFPIYSPISFYVEENLYPINKLKFEINNFGLNHTSKNSG